MKTIKQIITVVALAVFMLSSIEIIGQTKKSAESKKIIYTKMVSSFIEFGKNIPDCPCCYGGICKISWPFIASNAELNFTSNKNLSKYLSNLKSQNEVIIAKDRQGSMYLLVPNKHPRTEFNKGFYLENKPKIEGKTPNSFVTKKGYLNTDKYYKVEQMEGYKRIKIN